MIHSQLMYHYSIQPATNRMNDMYYSKVPRDFKTWDYANLNHVYIEIRLESPGTQLKSGFVLTCLDFSVFTLNNWYKISNIQTVPFHVDSSTDEWLYLIHVIVFYINGYWLFKKVCIRWKSMYKMVEFDEMFMNL